AFTTMKQNMDMHLLMQGVHRGDIEDLKSAAADHTDYLNDIQAEQDAGDLKDKDGKPMQLIMDGEYTNEQMLDMLQKKQISSVKDQGIPYRVVTTPNDPSDPSKGIHGVMMYKVMTNAGTGMVSLTDGMKKMLPSKYGNVPEGTPIPVQAITQNAFNRSQSTQAGGTVNDWQEEYDKENPDAKSTNGFSYKAWSAAHPSESKALSPWLIAHKGMTVDEAISGPRG